MKRVYSPLRDERGTALLTAVILIGAFGALAAAYAMNVRATLKLRVQSQPHWLRLSGSRFSVLAENNSSRPWGISF